jgi:hypothetical protein
MPVVGNAVVKLSAETAEYTKGLKAAGSDTSNFLHALKQQFGQESNFGGLVKLLKGAGAVAGLSLAANVVGSLFKGMVDVDEQFRKGEISAGEIPVKLAEGLPIIGGLIGGLHSFWDALDGSKQRAKDVADNLEKAKKAKEELANTLGQSRDLTRGVINTDPTGKSATQLKAAQIREDFDKQRAQIDENEKKLNEKLEGMYTKAKNSQGKLYTTTSLKNEYSPEDAAAVEKEIENTKKARQSGSNKLLKDLADADKEDTKQRQQHAKGVADAVGDFQKDAIDSEFDARQASLRAAGENLQADLDKIKKESSDRIDEIRKQADEAKKDSTPAEQGQIEAAAIKSIEAEKRRSMAEQYGRTEEEAKKLAEKAVKVEAPITVEIRRQTYASTGQGDNPEKQTAQNTAKLPPLMEEMIAAVREIDFAGLVVGGGF